MDATLGDLVLSIVATSFTFFVCIFSLVFIYQLKRDTNTRWDLLDAIGVIFITCFTLTLIPIPITISLIGRTSLMTGLL
jgi:hypothetical protein